METVELLIMIVIVIAGCVFIEICLDDRRKK